MYRKMPAHGGLWKALTSYYIMLTNHSPNGSDHEKKKMKHYYPDGSNIKSF